MIKKNFRSEFLADNVKREIKEKVLSGVLNPGDRLPSEIELAQEMGISRVTLREATAQLEEEGLLTRQNGIGTFVTLPKPFLSGKLEVDFSLSEAASAAGLPVETCDIEIIQRIPNDEEREVLSLKEDEEVSVCNRMRMIDGKPIVMSIDVMSANIMPIGKLKELGSQSLYRVLEDNSRCSIQSGEANLYAVMSDNRKSKILQVDVNEPLLLIAQLDYDSKGRPLLYSLEYYVSSRIGFKINRQRSVEQYALEYLNKNKNN